MISGVLLADLIEICLFASGFFVRQVYFGLGSVKGEFNGSLLDYFYFSAPTYSTLGVGDLFPTGVIRLVAGVEALTGFVLIGWSASFTYLTMLSWRCVVGAGDDGCALDKSAWTCDSCVILRHGNEKRRF